MADLANKLLGVERVEKKYSISELRAEAIRYKLEQLMLADPNNHGTDGYLVRSLYFDTPWDTDYFEKEDGYNHRKKIRLRVYDPKARTAKLERKEKLGDNQWKSSLIVTRDDALCLTQGDYTPLLHYKSDFSEEMYRLMNEAVYRPKVMIEYDRIAFYIRDNDTRITFDKHIRANEGDFRLFAEDLSCYPVIDPSIITMEVKYNRFLMDYIRMVIQDVDTLSSSSSKYASGRYISLG